MRAKSLFLHNESFSWKAKKYFEAQTPTIILTQSNCGTWEIQFAAPELVQEFDPGNQNDCHDCRGVELVSPIAAFGLYTELFIGLHRGELFIQTFVCLNDFMSIFLFPVTALSRVKKILCKNVKD